MTTYSLPSVPDADVIWTTFSAGASVETVTRKWQRIRGREGVEARWCEFAGSPHAMAYTWAQLLEFGVVHDTHPDLGDASRTPWKWDDDGAWCIRDAGGRPIEGIEGIGLFDAVLIVKAVNAYAERYTGGAS